MKKGQILLAVLLIFVILSLVMVGLIFIWEDSVRKTGGQRGEKQALYLAEGAGEIAIYSLVYLQSPSSFTLTGAITETDFSGKYTVSLFWYSPTFEIVSSGEVDLWARTLRIKGIRSGTSSPYTITITSWVEE
ncbi:MAG: pilus assembly PilX N-terminal domain-containing protein [Dictyoglomaceae bacterium]